MSMRESLLFSQQSYETVGTLCPQTALVVGEGMTAAMHIIRSQGGSVCALDKVSGVIVERITTRQTLCHNRLFAKYCTSVGNITSPNHSCRQWYARPVKMTLRARLSVDVSADSVLEGGECRVDSQRLVPATSKHILSEKEGVGKWGNLPTFLLWLTLCVLCYYRVQETAHSHTVRLASTLKLFLCGKLVDTCIHLCTVV